MWAPSPGRIARCVRGMQHRHCLCGTVIYWLYCMRCTVLWCTVMYEVYCTVVYCAVWGVLYCGVLWCMRCTVLCCDVLWCMRCTVVHCAVWGVLYCDVLGCTVMYEVYRGVWGVLMYCDVLGCTTLGCTEWLNHAWILHRCACRWVHTRECFAMVTKPLIPYNSLFLRGYGLTFPWYWLVDILSAFITFLDRNRCRELHMLPTSSSRWLYEYFIYYHSLIDTTCVASSP
jgi:hypothetical protein